MTVLAGSAATEPATGSMLNPQTYYAVLFAVSTYAFLRGRTDERVVASICIIASFSSALVAPAKGSVFSRMETGILIVDVLALAAFVLVALRSERFWPLWVAGLQLTTLLSHIIKAARIDLMPQAYGAAARFWVYPIFLIIVIGTWRGHRRRVRAQQAAAP